MLTNQLYHFQTSFRQSKCDSIGCFKLCKRMGKKKYGSLVNVNWSMDDYNSIIITSSDQDMGTCASIIMGIFTRYYIV